MNDLISRRAAVEALEEPLKVSDTWTDEYAVGERMQWEKDVKALNSLPPAQQWIPVSERLPKAGVRYQVTFESGEVGYADFRNKIFLSDGSVKENVWETERYYEDDGEVTAWMPLPKPYRKGANSP